MTNKALGLKLGCQLVGMLAIWGGVTEIASAHRIDNSAVYHTEQTLHALASHGIDRANNPADSIHQFSQELLHTMFPNHRPTLPQLLGQSNGLSNEVSLEERDGYRYIDSNGIPEHETGTFPNPGNPNRISAQSHRYRISLNPQLTETSTPVRPAMGIALNGVPFEPGTAEFWNNDRASGWNYDALSGKIDLGLDINNAHVQPTGSYHYHGLPTGLLEGHAVTLIGYAADGFPIYGQYGYADPNNANSEVIALTSSYRVKAGQRPSGPGGTYDGTFVQDFEYIAELGDLDDCNGRFGVTPQYPEGIYHYYITTQFPFIPRCVKGIPDDSFQGRSEGDRPAGPPSGQPRQPGQGAEGRGPRGSNGRPPFPPPGGRPHSPTTPQF